MNKVFQRLKYDKQVCGTETGGTTLIPGPIPICCFAECEYGRFQAFSQRGVRVSFGHPIADSGYPNIHIFCTYNAMR